MSLLLEDTNVLRRHAEEEYSSAEKVYADAKLETVQNDQETNDDTYRLLLAYQESHAGRLVLDPK